MKPRISARLPVRLHAQLAGAAGRSAASQTRIIVEALESFLAERPDAGRVAALERRLDRVTRQLDRLERNGLLLEEALAVLAEIYFTLTPVVPVDARAEAHARRAGRWAEFEARIGDRLAGGRRTLGRALEQPAPAGAGEAGSDEVGSGEVGSGEVGATPVAGGESRS